MKLLLDVGNSAIKWAQASTAGELGESGWQLHRGVSAVGDRLVERWRATVQPGISVMGCTVASSAVVSEIERAVDAVGLGSVQWLPTQRQADAPIRLVNGYRDPLQLGADRWHAMLGACALPSADAQPLVVVSTGTATTVDCIDIDDAEDAPSGLTRRFVGGVIAPGVRLMLEALAQQTAGLPLATGTPSSFPDNTDAAIITGVLDAQAGLVHRVWHRFAVGSSTTPRLILTGGYSQILFSRLSIDGAIIEHNLVLRGLALRSPLQAPG